MKQLKTKEDLVITGQHLITEGPYAGEVEYSGVDCFISLAGGAARSSKTITYCPTDDTFDVFNEIDGTYQELTWDELATLSNIREAMEKGAFYAYD